MKAINSLWTAGCKVSVLAICAPALAQAPVDQGSAVTEVTPAGQQGAEDIVVTAQKRAESVQTVPISINVLSGEQLTTQQVRRAEDLVSSVPNLQINQPLGEGLPVFSLRGISMSDYSLSQNGPIAVYSDEVYKGNWAIMGLSLFDLERVEVLKGPQGTLYGKNTTGGAINFISRRPNFSDNGNFSLGVGNYDERRAEGAIETKLSESLGARAAFTFARADGWQKNAFTGAPDASSTRQYAIRGSVRYKPNDIIDITVRSSTSLQNPYGYAAVAIITGPLGVGGPTYNRYGLPGGFRTGLGRREVNTGDVERQRFRTYAIAANAEIRLSDTLALTSITSYDKGTMFLREDSEGLPIKRGLSGYLGRTRQISQDLRIASEFDGPFNLIIGVYYNDEKIFNATDLNFYRDVDANGDGRLNGQDCLDSGFVNCEFHNEFDQYKKSAAVYSDFTYNLSDQVTFRWGLRYTRDRGKLRNFIAQARSTDTHVPLTNIVPGSTTDLFATYSDDFKNDNVSGRIGVDYKPVRDVLLYASYSRGYRGAAFNAQAFFEPNELSIAKPERVDAAEAGFKTQFLDRRVTFNGAVFRYEYTNQQTLDVDPATLAQRLLNLPKSRIWGAELDLRVAATDSLRLSAGIGLLDAKVRRGTAQGIDIKGNDLIAAPTFTLSSGVDLAIPLGSWQADTHADISYASSQYYDILNSQASREGSYYLLNGLVRFHPEEDRYGVTFWMKNITNTFYRTNRIDVSAGNQFIYTHVNRPRMYGVAFDVKF